MASRSPVLRNKYVVYSAVALMFSYSLRPVPASAESTAADGCSGSGTGAVKVVVRAIQASGPIDESATASSISLEDSLSDLRAKLTQLPFSSFKLISTREQQLEVKHQETVTLPNGQTLALRPMFASDHRVGLWLNWLDNDGSEILNTRLHFDTDDSLLTGTDAAQNEGVLLAIKARPIALTNGN
jgi:hypothetical protein